MPEARITFYQINKCGYYKRGEEQPEFCNLGDLCSDISRWHIEEELEIGDTLTFQPDPERDILPTYLGEVAGSHRDGYVISTWNMNNTEGGRFGAIDPNSRVGSARVQRRNIRAGYIPGYPSYFWLLPNENIFATIIFDGRLNGKAGLTRLFRGFLASHSIWCYFEDGIVKGYTEYEDYAPEENLKPYFSSNLYRRRSSTNFIISNRARITKIHRKKELVHADRQDKDLLSAAAKRLGIVAAEPLVNADSISMSIDAKPSQAELTAMLETVPEDNGNDDYWGDLGFQFEGDPKIHWTRSVAPTKFLDLDVQRPNGGLISTEQLLAQIKRHRGTVIPT